MRLVHVASVTFWAVFLVVDIFRTRNGPTLRCAVLAALAALMYLLVEKREHR